MRVAYSRMTRTTGPDCAVMCNLINIHTYYIHAPWEDQCEWHRMTRMTGGPDCAVMCNLINIHTYIHAPWEDQCEWHRMTRMTGPDCAVVCNLINIHTYIHAPWEDQCEWHRMTRRMTGPDCAVMCNLINTYVHASHLPARPVSFSFQSPLMPTKTSELTDYYPVLGRPRTYGRSHTYSKSMDQPGK